MDTAPSLYMRDHRRVGRWCGRDYPKRATTDYRLKDTVCDRSHRTSVHLITSHTLTQATQCCAFAVPPSAAAPVSCCSVPQCHGAPQCRSCRTEEHQKPLFFPGLCLLLPAAPKLSCSGVRRGASPSHSPLGPVSMSPRVLAPLLSPRGAAQRSSRTVRLPARQ